MESPKKQMQLNSGAIPHYSLLKNIDIDRDIRKHVEKTEQIIRKEQVRQTNKK